MAITRTQVVPSGRERSFGEDEIIVSKTDLQGKITYANDVFIRVSGYEEDELLGAPHSIIRHPDMPRAVFKLLWDTLATGREVFAYVNNMARNGDNYWVLAHVTPSFDHAGTIVGYHSNRRVPEPAKVEKVKPIYAALLAAERRHSDRRDGLVASVALLEATLAQAGIAYDEWVWSL
ncbi:MAG: PAS domain-containing protein [Gemmatimonadetes bacterium]|jgi:PAS domain S-box-containing protein|nr:PAS domain-containing protein [Gemmatimonadota bacterium]MBP9105450.1 PAS domain-containing protein [Gemmatimonadaceae bacterium]MBK6454593.1 PAS domain-containing protein [Gemmatimonadota bacterium]MBK6840799.1 PAS domain-containing protein [Gemmatimonadota bacterium]MBK8056773.1 PAS domain-containing protein [Gemmatimonadota bacterium]